MRGEAQKLRDTAHLVYWRAMMTYRLRRNMLDRVLGGVCGGIASTLGVSAWWVRIAFLALVLSSFTFGMLMYLLLWVTIPGQTADDIPPLIRYGEQPTARYVRPEAMLLLGALAILLGGLVLVQGTGLLEGPQGDLLAPGLLFLIGLVLLAKHLRGRP
jgi:phage shock protein PspC (stress-responsive transcriptional regulator)